MDYSRKMIFKKTGAIRQKITTVRDKRKFQGEKESQTKDWK